MRQSRLLDGSLSIHLYYYENESTSGRPGVFSFTVSGGKAATFLNAAGKQTKTYAVGKSVCRGKEHVPSKRHVLTKRWCTNLMLRLWLAFAKCTAYT